MSQDLSWNLHGNDQLSGLLEKLDRTMDKVSRTMDRVTGDAKRMGSALGETEGKTNKVSSAADKMGEHLSKAREKLGSLVSMLSQFAAGSAVALAAAGGAALAYGLKMAAANETARISFEVLLGSAKKAGDFLSQLQQFAAATPFEMPELRDAASRLLAVGVATNKIIPLLTRLGDATAGMGTGAEGIGRAVYALQQMSQAGKVSLEDINQLTDAGIPALDALATHLHTTVSKLRDEISAGKIKPDQLFDAILKGEGKTFQKLQGMMSRQSATLAGLWSTFQDNAGQALASFMEPAIPAIKGVLDWVSQAIPKAFAFIDKIHADLSRIFKDSPFKGNFMAALEKLKDRVLPALTEGWKTLSIWLEAHREDVEKLGRFVTEILIPAFGDGLVKGIKAAYGAVMLFVNVGTFLINAWEKATRFIMGTLQNLMHAEVAAFGWIPEIGPKMKDASEKFDEAVAAMEKSLNRLDGKDIHVGVIFNTRGIGASGSASAPGHNGRASGGPVWEGETYEVGENGREQYYAARTGFIQSNSTMRSMGSFGGGDQVIGTLRVVHETPEGRVLRTELLKLKRNLGGISLGFES